MISDIQKNMLRGPVGNNLQNDKDDILTLKRNFKSIDRYNAEVENGYIDRELHDNILKYQRDRDLMVDGKVNPGGETEKTLQEDMRLAMVEQQSHGLQRPLAGGGGGLVGSAAALTTARQLIDRFKQNQNIYKNKALDNGKAEACYRDYEEEIRECNGIRDASERSKCYRQAMERLAACVRNKDLPPTHR